MWIFQDDNEEYIDYFSLKTTVLIPDKHFFE